MRGIKAQFASCSRKVAYKTAEDAAKAGKGLGSYQCPICGRYHLTSSPTARVKVEAPSKEEPIFEKSIVSRAKLKQPKAAPESREEFGICLCKSRPDGRIRVRIADEEFETLPIQPASLRAEMAAGLTVRVRISGSLVKVIGWTGPVS